MDLGIVRIVNSTPVFSNPQNNDVSFILSPRSLQLSSSLALLIPYDNIDNIVIDGQVFAINLIRPIDTQLGTTTSINLLTSDAQQALLYSQELGRRNPNLTIHQMTEFMDVSPDDLSLSNLSISSDYYVRIDTDPNFKLNCNVHMRFTSDSIIFENRRGYNLELDYSNISRIDTFRTGLYLNTHNPIYPWNQNGYKSLIVYTNQVSSLLVSLKTYIK